MLKYKYKNKQEFNLLTNPDFQTQFLDSREYDSNATEIKQMFESKFILISFLKSSSINIIFIQVLKLNNRKAIYSNHPK